MKKIVILFIILFIALMNRITFANNEDYKTEDFWAFKMSKLENWNFIISTTEKNGKEVIIINGKQEFQEYENIYEYDISDNWKYAWFVWTKNWKLVVWIIEDWILEESYLDYNSWINNSNNRNKWFQVWNYWKDYVLKIWENQKDKIIINWVENDEYDTIAIPRFIDENTIWFTWFKKKWTQEERYIVIFDKKAKKFSQKLAWIDNLIETFEESYYISKNWNIKAKVYIDKQWAIISGKKINVNNKTFWPYKTDSFPKIIFSSDWKNYAFISENINGSFTVIKDDAELNNWDIDEDDFHWGTFTFSPNWKYIWYVKKDGSFDGIVYKNDIAISSNKKLVMSISICENNKLFYSTSQGEIYEENNNNPVFKTNERIDYLKCINNDIYFSVWYKIYKNLIIDYDDNLSYIHGIYWVWEKNDSIIIVWEKNKNIVILSKNNSENNKIWMNYKIKSYIPEYKKQLLLSKLKLTKLKKENYIKTIDEIIKKLNKEKWEIILEKIKKLQKRNEVIDYLEAKIYLQMNK